MRVLVTAASRHGSTTRIAEEIGRVLQNALPEGAAVVEVRPVDEVSDLAGYDAAVLGSAVYMGRWLSSARAFAQAQAPQLAEMPVWLFSSGPIGDPPRPVEDPADVEAIVEKVKARGHVVLSGKLDKGELKLRERAVIKAFKAEEGDFRDWAAIQDWARHIAADLAEPVSR